MTALFTAPVSIPAAIGTVATAVVDANGIAAVVAPVVAAAEVTAVTAAVGGSTVGTVAAGVLGTLSGPVGWGVLALGATASEISEPMVKSMGEMPFGDSFDI